MVADETKAVRGSVNGVSLWAGEANGGGPAAAVSVYGVGLPSWASDDAEAVALVRAVIAGEDLGEVFADYLDENPQVDHGIETCGARAARLLRAHVLPPRIHVRTWPGSGTATVTEMVNAGKRGKTCRTLRFGGWRPGYAAGGSPEARCGDFCGGVCHWLATLSLHTDFEAVRDELRGRLETYRAADPSAALAFGVSLAEHETRGVDAPKVELTAGVEGVWSAIASGEGVTIHALDDVNEWTEITPSRQHANVAYRCAAKVWADVRRAKGRHEVRAILEAAGCKFHGFCGRD